MSGSVVWTTFVEESGSRVSWLRCNGAGRENARTRGWEGRPRRDCNEVTDYLERPICTCSESERRGAASEAERDWMGGIG